MHSGHSRTTGILGQNWRASVTAWGDVVAWDGSVVLEWAIAADDRWHFPERETSTRQTWVRGTPVSETRVRVPNGDVVQRVWSASLRDGVSAILVEFTNDSPMPLAISLSREDVVTPRAFHRLDPAQHPWPSQDRGIERPAMVIPLGHRTSMRVALVRSGSIEKDDVDAFPDWEAVVRGWVSITDRASRIDSPEIHDGVPVEEIVRARRCEAALDPPTMDHRDGMQAIRWLIAHKELVRMGLSQVDVPEVVTVLEVLLQQFRRKGVVDSRAADALRSGADMLGRCDSRALDDFSRALLKVVRKKGFVSKDETDVARALASLAHPVRADVVDWMDVSFDLVSATERDIAVWSGMDEVTLVPNGFDFCGLGVNFEAHSVPAGPSHEISLAVRWHGERPAVIWEVDGPSGLLLRSGPDPQWTSVERAGETLWATPPVSSIQT